MEHQPTLKNLRPYLVLAAAIIFGSFSLAEPAFAVSAKDTAAKPVLETLAQISGSPLPLALPQPAIREVIFDVQHQDAKGGYNNSGGAPVCTPNPAVAPGTGFSPKINDPVRTTAINDLLGKIAACKPLPYAHDGVVNNNSEGHMPQAPKGYYKEYTLMVPGRQTGDGAVPVDIGGTIYMTGKMLSARGPERIIIGGGQRIYYTPDHYATFIELTIVK